MPTGLADLAPQSRGVDEPPDVTAQLDQRIHRVDGGARRLMDHRSLITREFVQQGALADVRLTDQRHPARTAARRRGLPHLGQRGEHPVEQVGHPRPCIALIACGSPRPSDHNAAASDSPFRCRPCWRPRTPACRIATGYGPRPRRRRWHRHRRRPPGSPHPRCAWPPRPARPPTAAGPWHWAPIRRCPVRRTGVRSTARRSRPGHASRREYPAPPPRGGPGSG